MIDMLHARFFLEHFCICISCIYYITELFIDLMY